MFEIEFRTVALFVFMMLLTMVNWRFSSCMRVSGHDVLMAMKADDKLKHIPVLVISGSDNPTDVDWAYSHQVSTYLKKPADLDQYFTMVRAIKELWFRFAALPRVANATSSGS